MLTIRRSQARRQFKNMLGSVNHYLITILVGLNGVEEKKVEKSEDFRTSWNPKDRKASSRLSRQFALKATTAWAVDAVDAYLILANRSPKLAQSEDLQRSLSGVKHSVSNRVEVFYTHLDFPDKPAVLLLRLLIEWRNRLVHYSAENDVDAEVRKKLHHHAKSVSRKYSGLDVDDLFDRFDSFQHPRFKEVASFVQASRNFVAHCDKALLSSLNINQYVDEVLRNHLKQAGNSNSGKTPRWRAGKIWNRTTQDTQKTLEQTLQNYSVVRKEDDTPIHENDYLHEIAEMTPAEAIDRLL